MAVLIPVMTWDWNVHLRFCEEKYFPLHVDCHRLLGLFWRAKYKILMWFWTLLFSLRMCSSLGIKNGFLAAVCQLPKRTILYVVTAIKNVWSAVGEEGDPRRRKAETGQFLLLSQRRTQAAQPLSCCQIPAGRIAPGGGWLRTLLSCKCMIPFGDHILSMVLVIVCWGSFIIHLNQYHSLLPPEFFPPLLYWLQSSVVPFIEGMGIEGRGMLQYWGVTWVSWWGARSVGLFPFGGGKLLGGRELSQGCSCLERWQVWELGRQKD